VIYSCLRYPNIGNLMAQSLSFTKYVIIFSRFKILLSEIQIYNINLTEMVDLGSMKLLHVRASAVQRNLCLKCA
jgi:hypothetical protein